MSSASGFSAATRLDLEVSALDRGFRIGVRVLHRSLQYDGFTPYVGYSFERTESDIELYEYRNHGAVLGVTRSF